MRRNKADNHYFFPLDFFEQAFQSLGENLHFPHVHYRNEIIAGLLIVRYGDLAYSWLSGSNPDYLHLRPNDLMFGGTIWDLKKAGFRYFVLGGGVSSAEDSLFEYKANFSKLRKDFYVYKRIHLEKEYERLVKLREQAGEIPGDFFPKYRAR